MRDSWVLPASSKPWHIVPFSGALIFANGDHAPLVLDIEQGTFETIVPLNEVKPYVATRDTVSGVAGSRTLI